MIAFEDISSIYREMCERSNNIRQRLKAEGYENTCGFYNNHSVKLNGEFVTQHYPIPVISIKDIGDVGVDTGELWFEAVLPKEAALKFNFSGLSKSLSFEIYGAENYLTDLYSSGDAVVSCIGEAIENTKEARICVLFHLGNDDIDGLFDLIGVFAA